MIFLGYLFCFSLLSILLDLTIFFSIISLFLGLVVYFDTSFSLQGIAICTFAILHLIARLSYHSRKMLTENSHIYHVSYNLLSISISTVIFAIPLWYMIIKLKIITFAISPLYVFIPTILVTWAILFKIIDRIFIHKKEVKEVILGDYFSIVENRQHLYGQTLIFKFKSSPDFYSAGMWRYKIFIEKIGSTFSCTFGKGIFGTTYITNIKLIEDAGINIPVDTNQNFSFHPKRSLTKKDYSFPWHLLLLTIGISIFGFGIFILYIVFIGTQNSDISLLKYIKLYKVIGISGIILGITLIIISIFVLIRKK